MKPIAALRDVSVDRSAVSVKRTLVGLLGDRSRRGGRSPPASSVTVGSALQLLGLGALTTIIGVFVLGPVIARPVVKVIGWPVARTSGVTGELARENATRSPKRTAATASALMVGVALVGFITILAASTKASVAEGVDKSFRADYVVESGACGEGGFTPALARRAAGRCPRSRRSAAAPGPGRGRRRVDDGAGNRHGEHRLAVRPADRRGLDGRRRAERRWRSRRRPPRSHGWTIGRPSTLTFARTGVVPLTVAATYEPTMVSDSAYIVDLATYEANVTDQFDQRLYVGTVDSVDAGIVEGCRSRACSTPTRTPSSRIRPSSRRASPRTSTGCST